MVSKMIKKCIPKSIRQRIRRRLLNSNGSADEGLTISESWERYAGTHRSNLQLGDEWNEPELIGIDVPADEIVPHLDKHVFSPYLGTCDTIMEIGPGGGRFTRILLPKCNRLLAVDTSPTMLDILAERFTDEKKIEYVVTDGQSIAAVADASVGAAFSYGVFVHLQHWDIFNYLAEVARVLKPGGKAIIQHANTFCELGWRQFTHDLPKQLNRHKNLGSFTVMSPQMMEEFARRAGLKLVDAVTNVVRRDCISLLAKA